MKKIVENVLKNKALRNTATLTAFAVTLSTANPWS